MAHLLLVRNNNITTDIDTTATDVTALPMEDGTALLDADSLDLLAKATRRTVGSLLKSMGYTDQRPGPDA